jgi:glycosyltransferase involved in cell wall biosynthesis
MKKASIVIVNYNEKLRIQRAILSALNQTWDNVEVIVVDDGSDQKTRDIYKDFGDRIKLVQLERDDIKKRTVPRALNAGIKASTGDYVSVMGSDDYFDSKYVETLIKLDSDIAICNWKIIGKKTETINIEKKWDMKTEPLRNYLLYNQLSHECMLCTREVMDKVGLYDERFPRSQDADWIVRSMLEEFDWKHTQDVLVYVEKHEDDQQKNYASIYGKTLWSLKNNVNIKWILNYLKNADPLAILSYYQAIHDFMNKKEWQKDYNDGEFKELYEDFLEVLKVENNE